MGKLTPAQAAKARRLAGTMFIKDLAREIGTSDSNLDRWARQHGVNINALKYPEALVKEVCEYYARHGKIKTQQRFANVRLRSIVERYGHEPRQVRWTGAQLIQLVRMAGLVSFGRQAELFNRPNAAAPSIKSVWMKRFGTSGGSVNGLSHHLAVGYVTGACPFYDTDFWETRQVRKNAGQTYRRRVALWVDVAEHLRPEVPGHLAMAIQAMASFQRWLHGKNYKASIRKILEGELA